MEKTQKISIGQYIKAVRQDSGMSIAAFAKRINKTPQNVNDIFGRTSIDTELLSKISEVLHHDFFNFFKLKNINTEAKEKRYKVLLQIEIFDEHNVDKITELVIGKEGLKYLKID